MSCKPTLRAWSDERELETELPLGVECPPGGLEVQRGWLNTRIKPILKGPPLANFSTCGELSQAIQVNQALTAVILGDP